MLELKKMND